MSDLRVDGQNPLQTPQIPAESSVRGGGNRRKLI